MFAAPVHHYCARETLVILKNPNYSMTARKGIITATLGLFQAVLKDELYILPEDNSAASKYPYKYKSKIVTPTSQQNDT